VAFSHYLQDLRGQILVFMVIAVAAAEAVIGLVLVIALFRNKPTVHVDEMNEMKG
jgi:NADH-quinone oxidoreductase subunit K